LVKCCAELKAEPDKYDIPDFAYKYAEAIGKTLRLSGLGE
jgi:hypothetical protein